MLEVKALHHLQLGLAVHLIDQIAEATLLLLAEQMQVQEVLLLLPEMDQWNLELTIKKEQMPEALRQELRAQALSLQEAILKLLLAILLQEVR